jgi:hypothetical protein
MWIFGLLIALPFAGAWWITLKIVNQCIKTNYVFRLIGVVLSLLVGGVSICLGYDIGPIVGWFIMFGGGALAIGGTIRSLGMTKEGVIREERKEKEEKEKKQQLLRLVKEEAERMLEQGKIENLPKLHMVCKILENNNEYGLSNKLKQLERKVMGF